MNLYNDSTSSRTCYGQQRILPLAIFNYNKRGLVSYCPVIIHFWNCIHAFMLSVYTGANIVSIFSLYIYFRLL